MKKITLLLCLITLFSLDAQVTVWEDSFESYPDFEIGAFGDWTFIDNDGDTTYGSNDFDFTNESYVGAGIIFNPSLATPDPMGTQTTNADQVANWQARTGTKGLWAFASTGNNSGTPLNDDYIITPAIDLTGASGGTSFTMWAKSVTANFGLERFEILLSTTGTNAADFTNDIGGGELQAPITDYTQFSADISAFEGSVVYIAIHYVAQDSFIFQSDDYRVEALSLSTEEFNASSFKRYYDKNTKTLNLESTLSLIENVRLYNILGQEVVNVNTSNTKEAINMASLIDGIYLAKVTINGNSKTFKVLKQ